jgi:hypothetical protein
MEYYVSGMMSTLVSIITIDGLLNKSERTYRRRDPSILTMTLANLASPLIYVLPIVAWVTLSPWSHFLLFVCPHIAIGYISARTSVSMDYVLVMVYLVLVFHAVLLLSS